MHTSQTQRPTLGALIRAWVCGWPISGPNGLDAPGSSDEDQATLKLIYDEVRLALEVQRAQKASLETKASILVGFAGTVLALLIKAKDVLIAMPYINRCLVLLGIVLFILSLFLLGLVFWVRQIRVDPNPVTLAQRYLNTPAGEVRRRVISNRSDAWQENSATLERSAKYLKIAFLVQGGATIFLAIALFISVFPR